MPASDEDQFGQILSYDLKISKVSRHEGEGPV